MDSDDEGGMMPENGDKGVRHVKKKGGMSLVEFSQVGLFVVVAFFVLKEMKPVLLPLVLAILVSTIVYPVYLAIRKLRVPRMVSAAVTVAGLMAFLSLGAYQAFLPAAQWLDEVDEAEMVGKVQEAFRPMKEVQAEIKQVADKVERATNDTPETEDEEDVKKPKEDTVEKFKGVADDVSKEDPKVAERSEEVPEKPAGEANGGGNPGNAPVKVQIEEDQAEILLDEGKEFLLGLFVFLLLVLFILAHGNRIVRQLNRDPGMEGMLTQMGREVSQYMFTITMINAGLGICIGLAMWGLGMPYPFIWGMMAMVLNFVPYLGALAGTFVVFLAAAVNLDQPQMVLAVPAVYFVLTALEGNLVTPTVLGGRFKLNPLIVFIWIFAWGGFWGIAGMLIAMPALVIFKIVCENTDKLEKFRRVLT